MQFLLSGKYTYLKQFSGPLKEQILWDAVTHDLLSQENLETLTLLAVVLKTSMLLLAVGTTKYCKKYNK